MRLNTSQADSASACVMIDRYTPRTRLRNARKPNISANRAGTAMMAISVNVALLNGRQNSGSSFTWFHTMKSGSALW